MSDISSVSLSLSSSDMLSELQNSNNSTRIKSEFEILNELKSNVSSKTKTAQQIAEEYGITLVKAQSILDQLNDDSSNDNLSVNIDNTAQAVEVNSALSQSYSYTVEDTSNMENSTMSYLVWLKFIFKSNILTAIYNSIYSRYCYVWGIFLSDNFFTKIKILEKLLIFISSFASIQY